MSSEKAKLLGDAPPTYSDIPPEQQTPQYQPYQPQYQQQQYQPYQQQYQQPYQQHQQHQPQAQPPHHPYSQTAIPVAQPTNNNISSSNSTDYPQPHTDIQPPHSAIDLPPDTKDLPAGWVRCLDSQQRPYYLNTTTRCSQWEHPTTGAVFDPNAVSYECPSYYEDAYHRQQAEPTAPVAYAVPQYDEDAAPSPDSPYHPDYYTQVIKSTVDQLDQAQLDSLPMAYIDTRKYAINLTTRQKCCGTFSRFKFLTALTALFWGWVIIVAVGLGVMGVAGDGVEGGAIALAPAALPYVIYFAMYVIPAGLVPIMWLCCGRTGCTSKEHIVETLRSSTSGSTDKLLKNIDAITEARPLLKLHVSTWHWETKTRRVTRYRTVGTGKNRRRESYRTTETYREKVYSYKGFRQIPIVRYRDLSSPSVVVKDLIQTCESNMLSVRYKYLCELHPSQKTLLETMRQQYYYENCYRDDHCEVHSEYAIDSHVKPQTDVVVKEKNGGYWLRWFFFFNPISFFLWAYAMLYIIPAIMFRSYTRIVPFDCVKYLHLGTPERQHDVCTYSNPRRRFRWTWWN